MLNSGLVFGVFQGPRRWGSELCHFFLPIASQAESVRSGQLLTDFLDN
jgi:hypothetical protein